MNPVPKKAPFYSSKAPADIRRAGKIMAVFGLVLPILAGGAYLTMSHPDTLFLVILSALGLTGLLSGVQMIVTGRGSMWPAFAVIGIMAGFVLKTVSDDGRDTQPEGRGKPDLVRVAAGMSQRLPKMLDSETRWDGVTAGPGEELTYSYTLVNHAAGELDHAAVSKFLSDLKKKSCSTPQMKEAFRGVTAMEYKVRGKDGGPIGELRLTAEECR